MTNRKSMGKGLLDWDTVKVGGSSLASVSTVFTDIDAGLKIAIGVATLVYLCVKIHVLWKNRNKPPKD